MSRRTNRRQFLGHAAAFAAASQLSARAAERAESVAIGTDRELFVDSYLIDRLQGVRLQLQRPRDEGNVFSFDKPWEQLFCGYTTVIKDGSLYRLYYRGYTSPRTRDNTNVEVTCVAESKDGKTWTRPDLGLHEVAGSRQNNVMLAGTAPFQHNFCPMIDTRPGVPAAERYKAVAGSGRSGLVAFVSEDGIHWTKLRDKPVFTAGAFDSQNVPFWSEREGQYLLYFRVFVGGVRRISRTTSKDFVNWTKPVLMEYGDKPIEHLYTNQTHPYYRAPQIYVSLAARFMPGRRVLTAEEAKAIKVDPGYFNDCSDGIFMTTRGGNRYDRTFMEGFIRPRIGLEDWVSRTSYPTLNVVPTGPEEMSCYANHNYGQPTAHLRRYSLRPDGFASVNASYEGGELLTKPLTFAGKELTMNFAVSAPGGVRVEIQSPDGKPIHGRSLADAVEMIGNDLERVVRWKDGADVSKFAGQPVRLRFAMKDGDLYSIRFR